MKAKIYTLLPFFLILVFTGCFNNNWLRNPKENIDAYAPVYGTATSAEEILSVTPKSTVSTGKIFATNRYIFQVDNQSGIHVIDRSTEPAKKIAFIQIPFCTELAVRGNILYTNSVDDLLAIDIRDLTKPVLIHRIAHTFPLTNQDYPPQTGYFECVDKSKGTVTHWELKTVRIAKCYR